MSTGVNLGGGAGFQNATRIQEALTASVERRALRWLAERTPRRVGPDHLTLLGLAAQFLAGVSYALAGWNKYFLLLATFWIAVNWLGDSLDGTLARYRQQQRPRYGFYVDHMVDTFGSAFLMLGLAVSGYLHWQVALAMLVAFLVLSVETYLAAYTMADFRLSHGRFGPTEIRLLLMIGNVALLRFPHASLFGYHYLLFDVGGVIASVGMIGMGIVATIGHTRRLYREERLP